MVDSITLRWFDVMVGTKKKVMVSAVLSAIAVAFVLHAASLIPLKAVPYAAATMAFGTTPLFLFVSMAFESWKRKRAESFKVFFGFEPPDSSSDVVLTQKLVDKRLRDRAKEFLRSCEREEAFLKTNASADFDLETLEGIEAAKARLSELRCELADNKHDFWWTHALAVAFGYTVRRSVKAYWR